MKRGLVGLLAVGVVLAVVAVGSADPVKVSGDLKQGALLYDNWLKMKDKKVEGKHPAYPAEGKVKGAGTWRCKECHGWDYLGKDGRYAKGSHFTGIKGVYDVRQASAETLKQALVATASLHDFSGDLTEQELDSLVRFIREGLIDIQLAIHADGSAKGNVKSGQVLYAAHCADCHGADGNVLDFKSDKEGIQGVGYLAVDNPQESLHKIRWGHPGSDMPSLVVDLGLDDAAAIDILAYSQTLK